MKCEFLMTYRAELKAPVEVGSVPYGNRMFFEITGGTFEGPRLRGKILGGGGDWLLIDAQGVARLDVRGVFATDDGARIYVQYPGVIVFDEKLQAALAGGSAIGEGPSSVGSTSSVRWRSTTIVTGPGGGKQLGQSVPARASRMRCAGSNTHEVTSSSTSTSPSSR